MSEYKFLKSQQTAPIFLNNIRLQRRTGETLLSKKNIQKLNGAIESVQKIISVYERAKPIIDKSVPVINNLKTTIKVARAFSGFSNSEIEKAFDQIPDSDSNESSNHIEQSSNKVAKPFYP